MLNPLEERILRHIISQNTEQSVPIHFDDVPLSDAISAVKSLAAQGYVLYCCGLNNAAAILQQKGKYYFEQKEQEMYGAYYDKIKLIEKHIAKLEAIKTSSDQSAICQAINEVFSAFNKDLPTNVVTDVRTILGLLRTAKAGPENYIEEVDKVIAALENVMAEIKIEASRQAVPQFIITQNQSQSQNQSVEISLNQVIREVQNIGLSPEETLALIKALNEFDDARKKKDKPSLWEKAKNVLKYIFDKSIEVGIAVLPYIAANLHL